MSEFNYDYQTIVNDAVYPAFGGFCHLATGIQEIKDQFGLQFATDLQFEEALVLFNKTEEEFTKDVVKTFINMKRLARKK